MEESGTPQRVLAIMAHPDDVDFGCAGTMAAWSAAGAAITYCLITDGDAGGFDETVGRDAMRELRRAEQRAAAREAGVDDVVFLGHPDGRLYVTHQLRRDISRVIRQVRPDRVVCQSPEINYERIAASHPDHRAAGEAALAAVYPDARNPFAHPELLAEEGLRPHAVPDVWISGSPSANEWVDITDTFGRKLAALRAHVTQTGHMDDLESRLRSWAEGNARRGGLAEGRLAESFRRINTA